MSYINNCQCHLCFCFRVKGHLDLEDFNSIVKDAQLGERVKYCLDELNERIDYEKENNQFYDWDLMIEEEKEKYKMEIRKSIGKECHIRIGDEIDNLIVSIIDKGNNSYVAGGKAFVNIIRIILGEI